MTRRRPLRLVIATNNLYLGGAQQLVVTHALHLPADEVAVTVMNLVGGADKLAGVPEPLRRPLEEAGVPVVDFRIRSIRDVAELGRALGWLQRQRPDIVHGHLPPADRWAAALGKAAGARTLATKHDTYHHLTARARWAETVAARTVVDRVVAISEATRHLLAGYFRVPARRLVTVPNPVDATVFDPAHYPSAAVRSALLPAHWPADAFVVGYVGRLVPRKGIPIWLAAAAELQRQRPDARFVLVGYGDDEAQLAALSTDLGLREAILFAGTQSAVPAWLAAFDALLYTPLFGEGLSIALLEAMSMALPIVASNVGANREQLDGIGLLPEPSRWHFDVGTLRPEPFAAALAALRDDPAERARLGAAARARVRSTYDLPVVLGRQMAVYRSLLGRDAP